MRERKRESENRRYNRRDGLSPLPLSPRFSSLTLKISVQVLIAIVMQSPQFSSSLFSARNALTSWRIVVSASSQSREPFCRRFGFPIFGESDDLEQKTYI